MEDWSHAEAAQQLGVTEQTLHRYRRDGRISGTPVWRGLKLVGYRYTAAAVSAMAAQLAAVRGGAEVRESE